MQVLSTAGQAGPAANKMAFVMESQYDLDNLPVPRDSRVERKQIEAGKVFAAWTFSGLPLDFEVCSSLRVYYSLILCLQQAIAMSN